MGEGADALVSKLLVANRGEIAVRILRTAADLGVATVAVHAPDEARARHVRVADQAVELPGEGTRAHLSTEAVIAAATATGADAVHPGYGFLAESPDLVAGCDAAGITFVGPTAETLRLLGDKGAARRLAMSCAVPVLAGTDGPTTLTDAEAFASGLPADSGVVVKAIAGGGGRGIRVALHRDQLADAFEQCEREAALAFGDGSLYVEELLAGARHIEVQLVGDGAGSVIALGDRECSIQRRRQKLLEIAPAPRIHPAVREQLVEHALAIGRELRLRSLATIEFLVAGGDEADARLCFLEGNARIQVEHTITEEIYGVDLVAEQLAIASGAVDLGRLTEAPPTGVAIQARVNTERSQADGSLQPSTGTLLGLDLPTGPGIRIDTHAQLGAEVSASYDSLLAKVVAHSPSPDHEVAGRRLRRALRDLRVVGVDTNVDLLGAVLERPEPLTGQADVDWFESQLPALAARADSMAAARPELPVAMLTSVAPAGVRLDSDDPLAVLDHGRDALLRDQPVEASDGGSAVVAPMQGTIIVVNVAVGDEVALGQPVAVMEAMKMEHVIKADTAGVVSKVAVEAGTAVLEGHCLISIAPGDVAESAIEATVDVDLDHIRPDLAEAIDRHEIGLDHRRPEAVDRRRRTGQRTARENLADLIDPGSYIEYGPLVIAPQRKRRTVEDLIANTPADGMIAGIGSVNGDLFGPDASRCVVMSYDYTVLAGTQGGQNHRKKDRLFELAHKWRLPVVFFTEGGGGRPGDTDGMNVAGLDCLAFGLWGELSGLVPLVGINSGYCFAGNAAILGCCDVIIATENSNIGMGGPAMIEGGGLGVYRPTEVGPMSVQRPNGVVDIAVADEAEAVAVAKQYLTYFQGPLDGWECADQRLLRHAIPENRLRVYDIRSVVDTLFDTGSVLELRRDFGHGMVTALARIEGRPVGVMANNPGHLAGAIDSDAADKASRFMQLCDAFDLPIVSLCDTPGFMVGPEHEKTALVRHVSRMFVTARSVTVPTCTIVLRKGYGLGAQAMASGGFKFPMFTVAWPTGEFGGMGLEGAVKLGYRKELEAVEDPVERAALYEQLVERMYQVGKGVSMADHFEIDDVIDPVDSRHWISTAFASTPPPPRRQGKKRPMIDTW